MKKSFDLEQSKRLTRILAGKEPAPSRHEKVVNRIKNSDPNNPLARDIYLFSFRKKFHQIEAQNHKVIRESDVKALLDKNTKVQLYYICTNEGMCPLPKSYVGKGAKAVQVKDDQGVIDYIRQTTGITLKKSDL
jgi:hypothetical protein